MDKVIRLDPETPMTEELLFDILQRHRSLVWHYESLRKMYEGDHQILHAEAKPIGKPDNRLVANFAKFIVDTFNGYFIGSPVKTTSSDTRVNDYLRLIDKYNNLEDQNSELSKKCDIYGHAFELLYLDEAAQVGIMDIAPQECILIRDNSIAERVLYGIRYYQDEAGRIEGTISDAHTIRYFTEKAMGRGLVFTDEQPNFFGEVPIIEYVENEERLGVFEPIVTLIDAYDKAISEKANDVDYFADAYMKIIGAKLDEETLEHIRDNRIINVAQVGQVQPDVAFLDRPDSDATQENLLDRLERLIFSLSMVTNISEDKFQTASGIAMQYKILPMSNMAKTKERKFTRGFNERYRLISQLPNTKIRPEDLVGIDYRFTRDLPKNTKEEADTARSLQGIVSDETLLGTLSIVGDAKEEMERIKEEEAPVSLYDFPAGGQVNADA